VPFERNPRFTGREPQLAQLEGMLFAEDRSKDHTIKIAITGLGGVGKTQLVLELLFRTREKHKDCSVIWIPNAETLHQAYLNVMRQLGIPGWDDDKADVKRLVQEHLSKESTGQWLLVFDNADDMDIWVAKAGSEKESEHGSHRLIDYLPRSKHGCIVFTTRDRKTAVKLVQQNVVEIPEMDENVATQLLQKYLVRPNLVTNRQDTATLLTELTYLPLAIVQAAAYINENGITLANYLSLLADQEEEVINLLSEEFEDDGRYRDVKDPVATTWLISFEQIRRRDPLAAEYLSFMACVDPRDIPQSLLPPAQSRKKEMDAIGTLDAYSFISRRPADQALDIHRLVHLATRNWLRKEEMLAHSTGRAIVRLEEVFPSHDHKNRIVWKTYLPHARYALKTNHVSNEDENRTNLVWRYGMCLYGDGRWNEAEDSLRQVMETRKRVLGTEHPDTLTSMANLASTYRNQGRWDQAEELEVQVMETSKRLLGPEHPDTLTSIANLAFTFWNQGRWKEAEKLFIQVIEVRKKVLGVEHPDTLTSIANLASTFWNQGQRKEAEELYIQAIESSSKVLGKDHLDTLTIIANLAAIYMSQGQWKEAEELLLQVIETRKRVLGTEHPDTLTSMANLALTYRNQGQWKEAEKFEVQIMETRKRVLGIEHPDTLTSMANLASIFWNQGQWKGAEELFVQVIEVRKKVLGVEHPSTLTIMAKLALTFWNQGMWKEAEKLGVQVMEPSSRVLGKEHPVTLTAIANLASTYRNQGRWKEAEELFIQVMEPSSRVLGKDHPDTLTIIANLASIHRSQGQWKEAEELEVQVIETRKRVLGAEHLDTLTSMNNLAHTFHKEGRNEEAAELIEHVVKTLTATIGANHPITLASSRSLKVWTAFLPYTYMPLDTSNDEIRLLKLFSPTEADGPRGTLIHTSLSNAPAYDALSYAWQEPTAVSDGELESNGILLVDNKAMKIGRNLEAFLQHFHALKQEQPREYIWIDSICINQNDMQERGRQVLRMREIYQKAFLVLVWLGPSHADNELAVDLLWELGERRMTNRQAFAANMKQPIEAGKLPPEAWWTEQDTAWLKDGLKTEGKRREMTALLDLLERAWWHRTWIIQEVFLAKTLVILCGDDHIEYAVFSGALYVLKSNWPWLVDFLNEVGIDIHHPISINTARQPFFLRSKRRFRGFPETLGVLTSTRNSLATDDRDKLYGILSIACDASKICPSPDYTITAVEVFKRFTASMIEVHENLDVLCLAGGIESDPTYPTWCPYFSPTRERSQAINPAAMAYGHIEPVKFRATRASKPDLKFIGGGDAMAIKGFRFDVVDGLGWSSSRDGVKKPLVQPVGTQVAYGTAEEIFDAIWQTLVVGLDRNVTPFSVAPKTFGRMYAKRSKLLDSHQQSSSPQGSSQGSVMFDKWYKGNRSFMVGAKTIQQWSEQIRPRIPLQPLDTPSTVHQLWADFEGNIGGVLNRRRFMTTSRGFMGVCPDETIPGDIICIVLGGNMPVVLKMVGHHFQFIGECYIHGVMGGEMMDYLNKGLYEVEEFEVH
jgi:tetratricopeptide (TPR) repeat protein